MMSGVVEDREKSYEGKWAHDEDLRFFFSSRRRHTRLTCDWSSDVCSSDLEEQYHRVALVLFLGHAQVDALDPVVRRSEERRVGKECSAVSERSASQKTSGIVGCGSVRVGRSRRGILCA